MPARPTETRRSRLGLRPGYTLTELLVVLAIIALLTGTVGFSVLRQLQKARVTQALNQIRTLSQAVEGYMIDTGGYPTTEAGLSALLTPPSEAPGWAGPYLDRDQIPLDPWGRAYRYSFDAAADRFVITSFGADGAEGGDGLDRDLTNR